MDPRQRQRLGWIVRFFALLLVLTLLWGSVPAAYAAGHSITVHAPEGNGLPYWEFEKAGVENAEDYILQVAPIENLTGGAITF